MTYTAPTVTKLQSICEASELPMNVRTSDRRNSRPTAYLKTIATELEYWRCQNSRYMSELPTVGTSDLCRNSQHSVHLKTVVGLWSSIPDTSGMTTTVNSPNYLNCESSELPTIAGTSDRQNSRHTSELPTNQPENNTFTVTGQIPDTFGMARPAISQLAFCLSNIQISHGLA